MSSNMDPLLIERSLLGCVIRQRDVLDSLPTLRPDDFMDSLHVEIWKAILHEATAGRLRSWDAVILANRSGLDLQYMQNLQLAAPRGKTVPVEYATMIRQFSFDRRVRSSLDEIIRSEASGDVLRALTERVLTNALDSEMSDDGPRLLGDGIQSWFENKAKMIAQGPDMYIVTGFPDIDRRMGGLRPGEVMIVAGRPGTGKTQFSLEMGEANARRKKKIHYISLEMMSDQMTNRMISRQGVHAGSLRNLHSQRDPEQVLVDATEAAKNIINLPIFVDYSSDDLASISARARRMKRKENIELLIVDYLQLVGDDSGSGQSNRVQEVGRISRGLKRLAVQLEIPIVALAQLNRSLEVNGNRRPQLSDLREAGSIEQDADFVMFLWRHGLSFKQEGAMPTSATNVIEAIFAKGREIEVGTEYLRTEFEHARFRSMLPGDVANYLDFIKQQNTPVKLVSGGGFGS